MFELPMREGPDPYPWGGFARQANSVRPLGDLLAGRSEGRENVANGQKGRNKHGVEYGGVFARRRDSARPLGILLAGK